jgi:hypothetical protein
MTDTRSVDPVTHEVLCDHVVKLRQISDSVSIGAAGDGTIAKDIFNSLAKEQCSYLEECCSQLYRKTREIVLRGYPLHFIIFGLTSYGDIAISALSSSDGFIPKTLVPQRCKSEFCLALPTGDINLYMRYRQMVKEITDSHKDIDDLRINLVNCIKEIHRTNKTISDIVSIMQITKGGVIECKMM